jgi:opacity protein-like surface antigen
MKNHKWKWTLGLLLGFSTSVLAQQVIDRSQLFKRESPYERYTTYRVSVTGGLGLPAGTFGDYMDKTTLRNYTLGLDFVFPKNNMSLGISVGSQYFQNRLPRQVYKFDGQDVSAVQTRTFSAYPLVLTGSYHIGKVNSLVRPYIQAGVGGAYAEVANYWGTIATGDNGFKFVAQAGAGVRVLFKKTGNMGLELGATYQHIPFTVENEGIKDASTLNVRAGLFYRWW